MIAAGKTGARRKLLDELSSGEENVANDDDAEELEAEEDENEVGDSSKSADQVGLRANTVCNLLMSDFDRT